MANKVFTSSATPAQKSCDHLAWLSSDLVDIPSPDTPCNRCQHPSDNYLCLYCKEVLCSRNANKHMVAHYKKSNHCLVFSYRDLMVFCYPCNAFLDAQAISSLRPVYETAVALKCFSAPLLRATASPGASQTDSRNKKWSPETPPTPPVDDTLLHINSQISSLETKIEKLVVSDTKLHSMKNRMDQYKSELSTKIDDLKSELRESEHRLRALIENLHEEMRAFAIRQHKEMRVELRQSEDRARALTERQHKEIMAYLQSKFSLPPQPQ